MTYHKRENRKKHDNSYSIPQEEAEEDVKGCDQNTINNSSNNLHKAVHSSI